MTSNRKSGSLRSPSALDFDAHGTVVVVAIRIDRPEVDFAAIDAADVLLKVAALPLATWTYGTDAAGTRHLGPTAEDFREAFGLGDSTKQIGVLDIGGVALAAVQGLNAKLEAKTTEQAREIDAQRSEIAELKRAVEVLMARTAPEGRIAAK